MEKELKGKMLGASRREAYEEAARCRDKWLSLKSVLEKQKAVLPVSIDMDCVGVEREARLACVQILLVRHGKITGQEYFMLEDEDAENEELLETFLRSYYAKAAFIPEKIVLPFALQGEDMKSFEVFLSQQKGSRAQFHVPQRGRERQLVFLSA